jgi:hypothetical protein
MKRISECSGIGSGKLVTVIPWSHPKARIEARQYPFVGGRTTKGWVAVMFEDGRVSSYPKNRIQEAL